MKEIASKIKKKKKKPFKALKILQNAIMFCGINCECIQIFRYECKFFSCEKYSASLNNFYRIFDVLQ